MAQSCSTFATLTQTRTIRTQSVVTTTSTIVSTVPASTFNITTTVPCEESSCPTTVIQSEIPAHPVTTQVPVILTNQVDTVAVSTLFGSGCAPLPNSRPSQSTPTPTPTPSSPTTAPTPSVSRSLSASRPSLIQTTGVTLLTRSDGVVTSSIITMTVVAPEETSGSAGTSSGASHSNLGPIVGGTIGGAIVLGAAVLALWYFWKKQSSRRSLNDFDMFEKDDPPLNTKSHHHHLSDHASSDAPDSFIQHQTPQVHAPQQYQPQVRYDGGAYESQAQYHHPYSYSEQTQGYQPDSQHYHQHHYDPQQGQQAQQHLSPSQAQGADPSSGSQQQYGDPRMGQQQQLNPHDWQAQGPEYQGTNAVGPDHGAAHGVRDPFVPVPLVGGYQQRDQGGYPQNSAAGPHYHYHFASARGQQQPYPTYQPPSAYNSALAAQSAPVPARQQQQQIHPGGYMPSGHERSRPAYAPEAPGAYDRYTSDQDTSQHGGGIAY